MPKITKLTSDDLYLKTFASRHFILRLGELHYVPKYSEPLIPDIGDIIVYVGDGVGAAKIGRVVTYHGNMELVGVAVIERKEHTQLWDTPDFDNVHEGDILCILSPMQKKAKTKRLWRLFMKYKGFKGVDKEATIRIDESLALLESMRAQWLMRRRQRNSMADPNFSYDIEEMKSDV